jgi:16S rRNA (uracil1498-N3)-methyltransferase
VTDLPLPKTRLYADVTPVAGRDVTRITPGETLSLFNGRDGEWLAEVTEVQKKRVVLTWHHQLKPQHSGPDCLVCFAPVKFGKIDFLAQKVTELGAAALQPVMTQYTSVSRVNTERLQANCVEAAEQCERVDIPQVHEPVGLRQLLADWPADRVLVFADESGNSAPAPQQLAACAKPQKWGILIGPEGGFSREEGELIRSLAQTVGVGLGPRILRADTAALSLLALSASLWGDWDQAPHFTPKEEQHG